MDWYLAQSTIPQSVLAEGFHTLDDAAQQYLAGCLASDVASPQTQTTYSNDDLVAAGRLYDELIFDPCYSDPLLT